MNVFFEFHKIAKRLQETNTRYALIGGVAMAFYGPIRATKDIDFLVPESDFEKVQTAVFAEGFQKRGESLTFKSGITLHRFTKFDSTDDIPMIVDVLVGNTKQHNDAIGRASKRILENTGNVYVATPEDMIWLKSARNSGTDKDDIEVLKKCIDQNEN